MLAYYGDLPIVTKVLEDNDEVIVENSKRTPRNEVARFILEDLDKAISYLASRGKFNGQRVNREAALLFKSRVALFEATFLKSIIKEADVYREIIIGREPICLITVERISVLIVKWIFS